MDQPSRSVAPPAPRRDRSLPPTVQARGHLELDQTPSQAMTIAYRRRPPSDYRSPTDADRLSVPTVY